MSNLFRYLIAGTTVFLLILGPLAWATHFKRSFRASIANQIRDHARAVGDSATANATDAEILKDGFGVVLSSSEMNRLWMADMLFKFWWLWSLLACGVGYGLFALLGCCPGAAQAG